jgi:hypothetical protein
MPCRAIRLGWNVGELLKILAQCFSCLIPLLGNEEVSVLFDCGLMQQFEARDL